MRRHWLIALSALTLGACKSAPVEPTPAPSASAGPARPATGAAKPDLVDAPPTENVAAYVKGELQRAARDKKKLVVYVGATWCEPCQRFHQALLAGKLDRELAGVRFVAYDLDRSRELLDEAGYSSTLIPLFCVPESDGRGGPRRIFGSIKGPAAVGEIMPRLQQLLADPAR